MRHIDRAVRVAEEFLVLVAGVILLVMVGLGAADTGGRYFLNAPLRFSHELIENYLMVAIVFLPAAYIWRIGGHVRVDLLQRQLPVKWREILEVFICIGVLTIGLAVTWSTGERAALSWQMREVILTSSANFYSLVPSRILVPVGTGLLCVEVLFSLVRTVGSLSVRFRRAWSRTADG